MARTILRGGLVLDGQRTNAERADILVDGERIADVLAPGTNVADAAVIDAAGKLLIPGLVNAHTHAQTHLGKGSADRWTLEILLNGYPWGGKRTVEHHYLSAALGAAEMVRKGCTTAYDMFAEFPTPSVEGVGAVAQAYRDVGMRACIAPMMADRSFYQAIPGLLDALPPDLRKAAEGIRLAPYQASLEACRTIVTGWTIDRDRVRVGLGPTIPHHCSDEFLTGCRDLAKEYELGIQMHVAESKVQAVVGPKRYGTTLVGHLDRLGMLGPHFTAAHGIWLDDEDMKRLGGKGASVAHNPGSNMKLGSGIAAVRKLLSAGVNVAVGTDGTLSSDNTNMFEAMRLACFVSRVQGFDISAWLESREALTAATESGAKALGFGGRLGRLAKGYLADIVVLDLHALQFVPLNDALNQVVHAEDGTGVESVMIGGRLVLDRGRFTGFDLPNLIRRIETTMETLRGAGAETRAIGARLAPIVNQFCLGLAQSDYPVHRHIGV